MAAKFWVALFLMMHAAAASTQSAPEPIRYTLSFPAPQTHYVEVTASVPTNRRADVDLMMAVWTPGSYLVRGERRERRGGHRVRTTWSPTQCGQIEEEPLAYRDRRRADDYVEYRVYSRDVGAHQLGRDD